MKFFTVLHWKKHEATQDDKQLEADLVRLTGKAIVCMPFQEIIVVTTRGHFMKTPVSPTVLLIITGGVASRPLKDKLLSWPGGRPVEQ